MKVYIVATFLSVSCANLVLAQAPDAAPFNPSPYGGASMSGTAPGGATAPAVPASPTLPSSGSLDSSGGACGDVSCPVPGKVCGPPGRVWISAEYILWWVKGGGLPPLATTGPATTTGTLPPGAFGPSTSVLYSGDGVDRDPFSGGQFTAGYWLDCGQTKGIEVSYFFLGGRSNDFTAGSTGAPGSSVVARPFFDVSTGLQNSELIGFPGFLSGAVGVHSNTALQGPQVNMICNLCCSCSDCSDCCGPVRSYRVDLIGGFRYLDLREGVEIDETSHVLPTSPAFTGDTISSFDQFNTQNQFYGGQIGLRAEVQRNRFFVNVEGLVALGDTHQIVYINGATSITTPAGVTTVSPGGLLALPSNIGHYSHDEFSVVPEGSFNIGYQVTNNVRVYVGYTILYWSGVQRPGDAIDLSVNSTRVPTSLLPASGPAAPVFNFHSSDFWAQGMNFGVELLF